MQRPVAIDPVHALEIELLLLAFLSEPRRAAAVDAIRGIGEEDRARRVDDDVIGAVQLLAVPTVGGGGLCSRRAVRGPRDPPTAVLAGEQVTVAVERETVRPTARFAVDRRFGVAGPPDVLSIAGDVAEDQRGVGGDPDRPLSKAESAAQPRFLANQQVGNTCVAFDPHHLLHLAVQSRTHHRVRAMLTPTEQWRPVSGKAKPSHPGRQTQCP